MYSQHVSTRVPWCPSHTSLATFGFRIHCKQLCAHFDMLHHDNVNLQSLSHRTIWLSNAHPTCPTQHSHPTCSCSHILPIFMASYPNVFCLTCLQTENKKRKRTYPPKRTNTYKHIRPTNASHETYLAFVSIGYFLYIVPLARQQIFSNKTYRNKKQWNKTRDMRHVPIHPLAPPRGGGGQVETLKALDICSSWVLILLDHSVFHHLFSPP